MAFDFGKFFVCMMLIIRILPYILFCCDVKGVETVKMSIFMAK